MYSKKLERIFTSKPSFMIRYGTIIVIVVSLAILGVLYLWHSAFC